MVHLRHSKFMSFSKPNEQTMKSMFSIAMPIPNMVHLYVNVNRMGLAINQNYEPIAMSIRNMVHLYVIR